ncbi:MAG: hypothetical protein SOH69_00720 [Olsenella sp.]|jgi:hypothetical protein
MQDNAEERSDTKKPRHERRKDKKQQKDQKTQKKPKGSSGFTGGFAAMRQVHAASKEHSNARSELKKAASALAEDKKVLDHRIDVTRSYAQIVSEQTKARTDAEKAKAAAERRIEVLKEEHDKLAGELEAMRSEHAEALKPFQNVMESTRGRADDTAKLLSEAKKAAKAAQTEANDAQARREQRISAANKAYDNAQARLRKLNADFEELKGRPDTDAGAIARMEQEISAEKAHLESTKADIPLVTDEAQKNVDAAQRHLWNQRQALDSAQKAAEEASTEAKRRKAEYDERYQSFQTEEATLDNDVVQREMGIRDASKDRDTAQANIEAAQKLLDEAEDIHAHPEVTKKLAESVAEKQHLVDIQKQEVSSLARSEKQLRSSTRKQRITFISLLIVIAAVILLIIWFLTH